jgi:endoglucanase
MVAYARWSLPDVLGRRPAIRVNQAAYLPGRPMQATMISASEHPLDVVVRGPDHQERWCGRSKPWLIRPDRSSGLLVHLVDFSEAALNRDGCWLEAGELRSHPFQIGPNTYERLSLDALRVFRLLRSGQGVPDELLPGYGRPAGHVGRTPNTGDVAVPAWHGPEAEGIYPGWRCPGAFDVHGGWYDAGDYGKYVPSGSIAVWQLLSTLDVLSRRPEHDDRDFVDLLRAECRWQLEWLLRMQVPPGLPMAGLAFHRVHGTEWSPLPGWAHEDPTIRVLHRPSTPATFQLAAAAAHGARHFAAVDEDLAQRLLGSAHRAYAAAGHHPMLIAPDDHARYGGGPYGDDDAADDRYWAAVELWLATGHDTYLDDILTSPLHEADVFDPDGFDFDRVAAPARLDLALHGTEFPGYVEVKKSVGEAADRLIDLQRRQPWSQPYAPEAGWDWGSNGRLLNNLVVLVAAELLFADRTYGDAVAAGADYLFGRNALGQSYITGYGVDDTRHQRTRQFGHDLDPHFPPPPPGALAGGANSRPHPDFGYDDRLRSLPPQCCYLDEPTSEVTNDICIRWNAPLVYVSRFLSRAS